MKSPPFLSPQDRQDDISFITHESTKVKKHTKETNRAMEKLHLVSVLTKQANSLHKPFQQAKKDIQSHADSIETSLSNMKASTKLPVPKTTTATICMVSVADKSTPTRKKESESSQKGKLTFDFNC